MQENKPSNGGKQQVIDQLIESISLMRRSMEQRKSASPNCAFSPVQAELLYILIMNKSLSIKEIAAMTHNSSSATTQIVEGLVKGGFLVRSENKKDRRIVHVSVSAQGKKVF